jgi:hypothetical protein
LSSSRELSQKRDDEERGLTVETGSRFIQEEQGTAYQYISSRGEVNLRLADKLDTYGETFPLLDTQSSTRLTDHGILNIRKLEQLNDDIDVS